MKKFYIVLLAVFIFISCKKENSSSKELVNVHGTNVAINYYFKGIIKDTTSGNSLNKWKLTCYSCNLCSMDTISDSTYFIQVRSYRGSAMECYPKAQIEITNQYDSLIDQVYIHRNHWIQNDTASVDILF